MYYPSRAAARQFRQKNFLIPLKKEIEFKAEPLELYGNICSARAPERFSFLFESRRRSAVTGRFSFVGAEPFLVFQSKGQEAQIIKKERSFAVNGGPVEILRSLLNEYKSIKIPGISGFTGGAAGYFAYDCCRLFEELPPAKDDLGLPDIFLMFFDTVAVFDHLENKTSIISNIYPGRDFDAAYDEAVKRIERFGKKIESGEPEPLLENVEGFAPAAPYSDSTFTKEGFKRAVMRAKEYIAAGDIYQANLSQRFCLEAAGVHPLALYRRLSEVNPSPFACYLDFGGLKIAGSSPERLLKMENNLLQTRPIAGTKPRGKNPAEDLALSCELILSDKERAEHIMLVDLERNDLGRVCEYGSVKVNELMVLEDYSHVIHIVSNIIGSLRTDKDRLDVIQAVFPGGTITGCPKIRSMQIINELEPTARSIYTGSVGYLDFNGDMDLNIVIRTFVIKDSRAYVQVGAGIVADSDPEKEYYETLYKAEALFEAAQNEDKRFQSRKYL